MPFKIVETIEDSEICLTIVPSTWEENGTLFWPNKRNLVAKLSQDEHSTPTYKWERTQCIKREEFESRSEAQCKLNSLESRSESPADDPRSLTPAKKLCTRAQEAPIAYHPDLNDSASTHMPFYAPGTSQSAIFSQESSTTPSTSHYLPHQSADQHWPSADQPQELFELKPNTEIIFDQNLPENFLNVSERANLTSALQLILDNQTKIIKTLAGLQTSFNELSRKALIVSDQPKVFEQQQQCNGALGPLEPVKSVQELDQLEQLLKDDLYFANLVRGMEFICGCSGESLGIDCCYKLIDFFLTREFLLECSWTGNARPPATSSKVALKFYEHFRKCFLTIVRKADRNFTEIQCEHFFKIVMKNSKQRTQASRTRVSKHKSRPKHLQYRKVARVLVDGARADVDPIANVDVKEMAREHLESGEDEDD